MPCAWDREDWGDEVSVRIAAGTDYQYDYGNSDWRRNLYFKEGNWKHIELDFSVSEFPDKIGRCENMDIGGIPVVISKGTPYEIGLNHGKSCPDRVR